MSFGFGVDGLGRVFDGDKRVASMGHDGDRGAVRVGRVIRGADRATQLAGTAAASGGKSAGYIVMEMLPTRRELLELAARAGALPFAAEFFAAWLSAADEHQHKAGSAAPPEPPFLRDYRPKFFSAEDFGVLQSFTEILIPTDDTPGAKEAHCAHYIDFVLQASEDVPASQKQWRAAMESLKAAGFHAADAKGRLALMEQISRPEREPAAKHPAYAAYQLIKRQNTFAFYTSRAGMIDALDYRGNTYNATFPACTHPEHRVV